MKASVPWCCVGLQVSFLHRMHSFHPSVVALDENRRVVGYVLVCTTQLGAEHKLLGDLLRHVQQPSLLASVPFILSGQLCVAEGYRGHKLAARMYHHVRCSLKQHGYVGCVTDIPCDNPRSLKAHQTAGFSVIDTLTWQGVDFQVVYWDWKVDGQ
jgi:hypothetical protein